MTAGRTKSGRGDYEEGTLAALRPPSAYAPMV